METLVVEHTSFPLSTPKEEETREILAEIPSEEVQSSDLDSSPSSDTNEEYEESTNDSSSQETSSTLAIKDDNISQQDLQPKSEKQSQSNNDAYIAKLLEKLIKERDRLVELGILMTQGESTKKQSTSPKANQENQDPQEEVPVQKSKRRQPSVIPDIKVPQEQSQPKVQVHQQPQVEEKESLEEENARKEKLKLARLKNYKVEELVHVSRKDANFGTNMPGQIVEEGLEVVNRSNENLVVEILIDCLNEELQDTDEYVYSIRRSHAYDYNDKHYLIMAPFSSASFRLALKVPALKINDDIRGQVRISIQGVPGRIALKMNSGISIPRVFCPRELYYKPLKTNIVKVAIKQGKKLETKIPLKNTSDVALTLDLEFHKSKETMGSKFDLYVYPTTVTVPAGGMSIVTLMLKNVGAYKDTKELLKRVLIGKARDSSLTYSFFLWIETY